ncbi:Rrf2 family transcriptional regulator [Acinetobacter kookii]|uniref:Transcriptional regulator, BadM/Rrf2 family n=1 Tax=Acinetobacter kookii TaxID=1226327 RepID=A0A1G6PDQ9_9GAMM|nr:Rrf2 family transcriptional regulator [Acinetobacter kookii]SDC77686.1 transcriptional regulator, BadM/Rrf2 family [Acinetobacter kookii]
MQLNKFTDYALRILIYIAQPRDMPYTIAEIAQDLHVSKNHLVKIVHFMGKQNWLITTRGKGGGIALNPEALEMPLGQIVRILQGENQIVECNTPPCVLRPQCGLKGILDLALEQFYLSLDQYTLAQVLNSSPAAKYTTQSPIQLINL